MMKTGKPGGYRPGAGRPCGSGKFREKTAPIRIPERLLPQVREMLNYYAANLTVPPFIEEQEDLYLSRMNQATPSLPLYSSAVAAGFPAPADDHIETTLDLNEYLVKHPGETFCVRVKGDSMIGVGIHEGDLLVVDRALKPSHGKIVIAVVNGELTVKRLQLNSGKIALLPENENYAPITINSETEFNIWGVVTNVLHSV
jgi:DNA polymerase V